MSLRALLLSLLLFPAVTVYAQAIYKVVGPDGKVVFSDKPPADVGGDVSVIEGGFERKQSANEPAADVVSPPVPRVTKQATVAQPKPQAPAQMAIDPALVGAVFGVMGFEDLVLQTERICTQTLPTSMKRYSGATQVWRQRNASVLARYQQVLAKAITPVHRKQLEAEVKTRNEKSLLPVVKAPAASRISWCDKSGDLIGRGDMDVHNKPALAGPLLGYR
ncbi:MAG TPA: hypothetical protein DF427_03110 [Moraxellaceae bacterium]|nr:hypothetical protein [Moraxellaceae bacterium]